LAESPGKLLNVLNMIKHFERHDCAVYFRSVVGCVLLFVLGWRMALVAMACIPLMIASDLLSSELLQHAREDKKAHEGSSQCM